MNDKNRIDPDDYDAGWSAGAFYASLDPEGEDYDRYLAMHDALRLQDRVLSREAYCNMVRRYDELKSRLNLKRSGERQREMMAIWDRCLLEYGYNDDTPIEYANGILARHCRAAREMYSCENKRPPVLATTPFFRFQETKQTEEASYWESHDPTTRP